MYLILSPITAKNVRQPIRKMDDLLADFGLLFDNGILGMDCPVNFRETGLVNAKSVASLADSSPPFPSFRHLVIWGVAEA